MPPRTSARSLFADARAARVSQLNSKVLKQVQSACNKHRSAYAAVWKKAWESSRAHVRKLLASPTATNTAP